MNDETQVDGDEIRVLKGVEGIRLRPWMYVGPLESPAAVGKLLIESMCSSLENAARGCCSAIRVSLETDGTATVWDDGPGFDLSPDPRDSMGRSGIEILLTQLFACRDAKADPEIGDQLCQIGLVCTNGLSEWLVIETAQDGWLWRQRYECGEPVSALAKVEPATDSWQRMSFLPDASILESTEFRVDLVKEWFEELTIDFGDVAITLEDKRDSSSHRLRPRSS